MYASLAEIDVLCAQYDGTFRYYGTPPAVHSIVFIEPLLRPPCLSPTQLPLTRRVSIAAGARSKMGVPWWPTKLREESPHRPTFERTYSNEHCEMRLDERQIEKRSGCTVKV